MAPAPARRPRRSLTSWLAGWLPLIAMGLTVALCAYVLAGPIGAAATLLTLGVAVATLPRVPVPVAMRVMGAVAVAPDRAATLRALIAALSRRAGLAEPPQLYRLSSPAPNAFAVGDRRGSGIAVSDGLLSILSGRELAAVLAHEIAHLAAGDTFRLRLAELMARLAHMLALTGIFAAAVIVLLAPEQAAPGWLPILLAVVPSFVMLLQLAVSRAREFAADREAVALTGDPAGLAMALARVEAASRPLLARLLPLPRRQTPSFLRSHPSTAARVRRLTEAA